MKRTFFTRSLCGLLMAATVFTTATESGVLTNVTALAAKKTTSDAKVTWTGEPFNKKRGVFVGKTKIWGGDFIEIKHMKSSARYWFSTSSKNLSIKIDDKDAKKSGSSEFFYVDLDYEVSAKKAGTYTVKVMEKYKNKTRTLKALKMYIYKPDIVKNYTAYLDNEFTQNNFIKNDAMGDFKLGYSKKFLTIEKNGFIMPKKTGKTQINVMDSFNQKYGTVQLTIKANHCKSLSVDKSSEYWDNSKQCMDINKNDDSNFSLDYFYKIKGSVKNKTVSDKITAKSSDPSVLKVTKDEDGWVCKFLKTGTAEVTINCGGKALVIPFNITD